MRIALVAAGLALVGGTTTACGGPPDDASKDDFCEVIRDVPIADDGKVKQADWDDWLDKIKDTGTPEDISDDARDGFETSMDLLEDLDVEADEDEITEDIKKAEDDLDDDEKDNVEKFDDYVNEACSESGDVPSADLPTLPESGVTPDTELPSDMPSDMPSGLPTEMPSSMPTDPEELESLMSDYSSMMSDHETP